MNHSPPLAPQKNPWLIGGAWTMVAAILGLPFIWADFISWSEWWIGLAFLAVGFYVGWTSK